MCGSVSKLLLIVAILSGGSYASAQTAADNTSMGRPGVSDRDERPSSIRDSLEKMRIEREKKDFDRMIERGEEAVKIAAELEGALLNKGRLTEKEMSKLASVEKLAKQIRNELGGDDDDELKNPSTIPSANVAETIKSLRDSAEDLFRELKKISRFTISATAIQCSNAVLRLARFARGVR